MAPEIVAELGAHESYFEPFCGSMAVLFAKRPTARETVNDLHGELTNLARVLTREADAVELYRRTSRLLFSEGLLRDALDALAQPRQGDPTEPDAERAYFYFIRSWMQRNGDAGRDDSETGYSFGVRYRAGGDSGPQRFRRAVERIPRWHNRLRNVVILNRDAFEIIPKFEDAPGTAIYLDPPYTVESRAAGTSHTYQHEFNHAPGGDHERLRDALAAFEHARIVISYYDCPRLRELYADWNIVAKPRRKQLANMTKAEGTQAPTAPEILIINGPSFSSFRQNTLAL